MKIDGDLAAELRLLTRFLKAQKELCGLKGFRLRFFKNAAELKRYWGSADLRSRTRSHKKLSASPTSGLVIAVELHFGSNQRVGVDLELLSAVKRPIFQRREYLARRFKLPERSSSLRFLREWCAREAAYKAAYPDNRGLQISSFLRKAAVSKSTLSYSLPKTTKSFEVRFQKTRNFLLAIAVKEGT